MPQSQFPARQIQYLILALYKFIYLLTYLLTYVILNTILPLTSFSINYSKTEKNHD